MTYTVDKMEFEFEYDCEDDVLSVYNPSVPPAESVEFSENIVIDIDDKGDIVGLEIFDASEFFGVINENINKAFLEDLEEASLKYKNLRNTWFIVLILKSKGRVIIQQPMPLLRKSEYKSPLII